MSEKIIDAKFEEVSPPTAIVVQVNPELEIERLKTRRTELSVTKSKYRWDTLKAMVIPVTAFISCARMCEAIAG